MGQTQNLQAKFETGMSEGGVDDTQNLLEDASLHQIPENQQDQITPEPTLETNTENTTKQEEKLESKKEEDSELPEVVYNENTEINKEVSSELSREKTTDISKEENSEISKKENSEVSKVENSEISKVKDTDLSVENINKETNSDDSELADDDDDVFVAEEFSKHVSVEDEHINNDIELSLKEDIDVENANKWHLSSSDLCVIEDLNKEIEISQNRNEEQKEKIHNQNTQIQHLQNTVKEQQEVMTKLQSHVHNQQINTNLQTTSLRAKLRKKDHELKQMKSQNEQNMSTILAHLLYIEGQMQKDQKEAMDVIQEQEDVIRRQRAAIEDLALKNEKLLKALKETHGYLETGKAQPDNVVHNGNVSIQDHGNKVVLRSHKDKTEKSGGSHKVRFTAMKERLRRHKSSLELYHSEPLETLEEGSLRYYGSQEDLLDSGRKGGLWRREDRKVKSRSLIDYPHSLRDVDEAQNESPDSCFGDEIFTDNSRESMTSSTPSLVNGMDRSYRRDSSSSSSSSSTYIYGFNELSKSKSVPHALPTVSENDAGVNPNLLKERPHSLPSVDLLASEGSNPKVNMSPSLSPTTASPPSDSNPFKSFKNVFKRRGSKKKRSVSLPQGTNQEYHDALKQHFKKYDLT